MCRKLIFAVGKVAFALVAAYAMSRVCAQGVSAEEVEREEVVVNEVNEGEEEAGGDEVVSSEESDAGRTGDGSVNTDEGVRIRGEAVNVEEVVEGNSDGVHSDEEGANVTRKSEKVVTKIEVNVDGMAQVSEEDQMMEDDRMEDQESEEEEEEDLEISEGEARLRGVVKVVEDIPIEGIEIVDGRYARVKVDVRFDVRFQLDHHCKRNAHGSHGQADN